MKRLMEKYAPEELAESFVFKSELTLAQKTEADKQLNDFLKESRKSITPEERLYARVLQLKFLIEDYIKSPEYNEKLSFAHFLREYINVSYNVNKDFANDIDIKETELSQLLNNHRNPSDKIIIRLEVHSNNIIPAVSWSRLVEKEKEYEIANDQSLRARESKHVKKLNLNLSK